MIYNLCTLGAKNYAFKILALYSSVRKNYSRFNLWVLCMDEETYTLLKKMKLENVKLITLSQFEDKKLLSVKDSRSLGEYCWTCTPSLMLYLFRRFKSIKELTYLDADLYFFYPPNIIYEKFSSNSIYLTPHRHSKRYKHLEKVHGKYNVGLLIFRRDKNGLTCLRYWRQKCLEWCYARREPHKYGDQFYLEEFPKLFNNVYVSKNVGVDVAPWNISNYKVSLIKNKQIYVNGSRLIFYHFANIQIHGSDKFKALPKNSLFKVSSQVVQVIYKPYFVELSKVINLVHRYSPNFSDGIYEDPDSAAHKLKLLLNRARGFAGKTPLRLIKKFMASRL